MTLKNIEISHNPVTSWETYYRNLYPKGIGRSADFLDLDREKIADGGYGRLRFTMPESRYELQKFFEYGLGRDIKIYNDRNEVDYQGFILGLRLNTGIHILSKSLLHIKNKIWARYDETKGVDDTQRSTVLDNLASQARFGIIEKVIGGGQQSGLYAIDRAVGTKLDWLAWPTINPDFGSGGGDPTIQILVVGYQHTLKWRTYNQTISEDNADLSVVATDVLTECGLSPNGFMASANISTNVMQVPQEYDTDRFAFDVLENLAAMGDSAGQRWLSRVEIGRAYSLGPTTRIR